MSDRERAYLVTRLVHYIDQIIFPKLLLRECCFVSPANKYKRTRAVKERERGQSARLVTSFRPPQLFTPQRAAVAHRDVDGKALSIYRTTWSLSVNSTPDMWVQRISLLALFRMVPQLCIYIWKAHRNKQVYLGEQEVFAQCGCLWWILSPCVSLDMTCHECVNEKDVTT